MRRILLALMLATIASGCAKRMATESASAVVAVEPTMPRGEIEEAWRTIASTEDSSLLDGIDQRWQQVLAGPAPRMQTEITALGALLDPAAGLDHPMPTPGSYKCRIIRLRASGPAAQRIRAYPEFFCYIRSEGERLTFLKQTGTDLPGGWLFQSGLKRVIFLGAQQSTAGDTTTGYGVDRARDRAGVLERIGPFRWRLAMALTGEPDRMDIYELVPVPPEAQPES